MLYLTLLFSVVDERLAEGADAERPEEIPHARYF